MAKTKVTLFLSGDVQQQLAEYIARHQQYTTTSQAADHLLRQALLQDLGTAFEELLSPCLRAAMRQELEAVLGRRFPYTTNQHPPHQNAWDGVEGEHALRASSSK